MHWTDRLHPLLIGVSDVVNRLDVDTRLLAASDVKLDRALFPLLSRLALHEPMNTVELANLVGRDHSVVSRQVAKLEALELVERVPDERDRRARLLKPSAAGRELLARVAVARRRWMEADFRAWPDEDIETLIALVGRMLDGLGSPDD
ncbi:MarR family winged helix-turn-helix transcriptional regulator [Sphingomonas corticis]|uniref:MarR family transcriptional regulator n=1 Tax=Sphingomonas corticis TaxID=2722791 RepID=A0ABX1CQ54_9SPHN|nr:MarR family transcriptional regulator [Sphingomonas corticis]NJR80076.1 MarR family transcriptional regulator [Sphingomonas corticis]